MLHLLSLFEARAVWTAPELAARLEVTERTVRRDVERLRDLGYPVEGTQGVGGGYRIGRGGRLPPLVLEDDEATAVAVALRVAAADVEGVGEAALRALAKLDQVLPARLAAQVHALDAATDVARLAGAGLTSVDSGTLVVLSRAIRDRVRLRFGYTARSGASTRRDVEPYRIVALGRRWYLFAWDREREDWRTFRVDRVEDPVASTFRFAPRPTPDPMAHVEQAVRRGGYAHEAVARYGVTAERLRRQVPSSVGQVRAVSEEPPASELVVSADDPGMLAWHLVRIARELGCTLEVLGPDEVRAALAELAEAVAGYALSGLTTAAAAGRSTRTR